MDCERLREVLIEHVDGLLGRDEAEFARAHLANCAPCRALQEEVRRNFSALDAWEDEELPGGAFERLRDRLPAGPTALASAGAVAGAAPRRRWVRLLVPYAAGLATAAAAMFLFVRAGADGPATPVPVGDGAGPVSRDGAAPRAALASFEDRVPAARDPEPVTALKPGERALLFRDADRGVLRKFFLPAGVDPDQVLLLEPEHTLVVPAGIR